MKYLILSIAILFINICNAQDEQPSIIAQIDKWRGEYQTSEFAPLYNSLVYPTQTADLSQRNNSVKPIKYEKEILAIWKKVFDDHLINLTKRIKPQFSQIYKNYKINIDKVYSDLLSNSLNYGQANSTLNNITSQFEQQIIEENNHQEKLDKNLKELQQQKISSKSNSQKINQINQVECSNKKTQLNALKQQQDTWDEMTAALNEGVKEPEERAKMEQTQNLQAMQTNLKISEISNFIIRYCK